MKDFSRFNFFEQSSGEVFVVTREGGESTSGSNEEQRQRRVDHHRG